MRFGEIHLLYHQTLSRRAFGILPIVHPAHAQAIEDRRRGFLVHGLQFLALYAIKLDARLVPVGDPSPDLLTFLFRHDLNLVPPATLATHLRPGGLRYQLIAKATYLRLRLRFSSLVTLFAHFVRFLFLLNTEH